MASFGVGANLATYGGRGKSPSLSAYSEDVQKEAIGELGQAAQEETHRNAQNKVAEAERKQSNQAMVGAIGGLAGGVAAGAMYGSAAGPYGMLIGGVLGAIAGSFM